MSKKPIKIWATDAVRLGEEISIHERAHIVTGIERSSAGIEATLEDKAEWEERTAFVPPGFRATLGRWTYEAQPGDSVADALEAMRRMLLRMGDDAG